MKMETRPLWVVSVLILTITQCDAVVKPLPLPRKIQDCYNNYPNITLKDVVGAKFCYFCEDRAIQSMNPLKNLESQDPDTVRYISTLVNDVNSMKGYSGRAKRQARFAPCRRKEYRMMADEERNRFHRGLNVLKGNGRWDSLASLHSGLVADTAHGGANFPGWHRVYLLLLEFALRRVDPRICIPYWDSSLDNELRDPTSSNVFDPQFMGGRQNGPVRDGPLAGWTMPWGVPLIRNTGAAGGLFRAASIRNILRQSRNWQIFPPFAGTNNDLEINHGPVHLFIGGQMRPLQTAAYDPFFFLHHAFIDYLWALFRRRQRARGINPQDDYPTSTARLHEADAPLGFGFNLTARDGYLNAIADAVVYDPSPTCNRRRPNCGNSRYFECNVQRRRCIPVRAQATQATQTTQTTQATLVTGRVRRAVPNSHLPPPPEPCMKHIHAVQNDYCIDGVCDIRNWVYVAINVVSVRPPGFQSYHSYPIRNGKIDQSYDIYQPSAYVDTRMLSSPVGSAPKTYGNCKRSDGIGQVYLESSGLSYNGFYKESSLVDQRLATGISVSYLAVKNPRLGSARALFRAFDSCGRICRPTCRIPGTKKFKACSGAVELCHVPGQPDQYSVNYGQASANIWNMDGNSDCPTMDEQQIPLTFYCDYKEAVPWTVESLPRRPRPTAEFTAIHSDNRECRVDSECTLSLPCVSACTDGDMHVCRGSCTLYAECTYGQFWKKTCSDGYVFDDSTKSCQRGSRCLMSRNRNTRRFTNQRSQTSGRQSHISSIFGSSSGRRSNRRSQTHRQEERITSSFNQRLRTNDQNRQGPTQNENNGQQVQRSVTFGRDRGQVQPAPRSFGRFREFHGREPLIREPLILTENTEPPEGYLGFGRRGQLPFERRFRNPISGNLPVLFAYDSPKQSTRQ